MDQESAPKETQKDEAASELSTDPSVESKAPSSYLKETGEIQETEAAEKSNEDGEDAPADEKVEVEEEEHPKVDPAMVDLLTSGFIQQFLPSLQKCKATVDQLKSSQDVLIETVQQETAKFTDCKAVNDVELTMIKARAYYIKLIKLRRDMNYLHEKSKKLKKRALKLQQHKQKEELTRAHDLEKEMERERMLTARVAAPSSPQ